MPKRSIVARWWYEREGERGFLRGNCELPRERENIPSCRHQDLWVQGVDSIGGLMKLRMNAGAHYGDGRHPRFFERHVIPARKKSV